jgi:hypothetical protein
VVARAPFWQRVGQAPLNFTYAVLICVLAADLALSRSLTATPIGAYLPNWAAHLWLVWYSLGALLVVLSFVFPNAKTEWIGSVALVGALIADSIALGFQFGFLAMWRGEAFYAALWVAYLWRLALLHHLSRVVNGA